MLIVEKVTGKIVGSAKTKEEMISAEKRGYAIMSEHNYKIWMFTLTGKSKWLE